MAKAEEMGIQKPDLKKKNLYENYTSSSLNTKENNNSENSDITTFSEQLENNVETNSQSSQDFENCTAKNLTHEEEITDLDLSPSHKKSSPLLEHGQEIEQIVANLDLGTKGPVQ